MPTPAEYALAGIRKYRIQLSYNETGSLSNIRRLAFTKAKLLRLPEWFSEAHLLIGSSL